MTTFSDDVMKTSYYNHTDVTANDTSWSTEAEGHVTKVVISVLLSLLISAIIVGNCLVVISVVSKRKMRTLSNGLIVSLASADLLLALGVLPISLQREVVGKWSLGPVVCDIWITADVFCCTASILNIVVIALDRYWLITFNVRYTHSTRLARPTVCTIMLTLAWTISGLIACSPLLGWRTGSERHDPDICLISQDYSYTIFSTFGAFWFPLCLILGVYARIFCFAQLRRRRLTETSRVTTVGDDGTPRVMTYNVMSTSKTNQQPADKASIATTGGKRRSSGMPRSERYESVTSHRRHIQRTRRSARTLGLIIGAFIICWMPFFVVATVTPFSASFSVPPTVASTVLWLGYSNSLFNPVIYAIWDPSFRRAFKQIFTCSWQ